MLTELDLLHGAFGLACINGVQGVLLAPGKEGGFFFFSVLGLARMMDS